MVTVESSCRLAKENVSYPALLSTEQKNHMLDIIAAALSSNAEAILSANLTDIENGKSLPSHLIDRLKLSESRIEAIADGIRQIIDLEDPIGKISESWTNHAGLKISRISVPLGVIGIIYEARPNVTCDVIALCIKTGNAVVLRGSKDAFVTNNEIVRIIKNALASANYNPDFIQLIEDTTRTGAEEFMRMDEFVDVLIPRGSAKLIKTVKKTASIPVIETGAGNCHLYIEKTADLDIALNILLNGKLQRPSVCNALESLLIDEELLPELSIFLSALKNNGVTIHGCEKTVKIDDTVIPATEEDYGKEYLGYEISCKVVNGVDEAIAHINKFSTHHSEAIITTDETAKNKFLKEIDSSSVYVNASTRFTDGFEFGFGAEMGISTQKLHARGPIGPAQLTGFKYQIIGEGQIRK